MRDKWESSSNKFINLKQKPKIQRVIMGSTNWMLS